MDLIFTSFSRNNSHGQIGDGSRAESVVPKPREDLPPVCQVAAGAAHSMVIVGRYLILQVVRKILIIKFFPVDGLRHFTLQCDTQMSLR